MDKDEDTLFPSAEDMQKKNINDYKDLVLKKLNETNCDDYIYLPIKSRACT